MMPFTNGHFQIYISENPDYLKKYLIITLFTCNNNTNINTERIDESYFSYETYTSVSLMEFVQIYRRKTTIPPFHKSKRLTYEMWVLGTIKMSLNRDGKSLLQCLW